MTSTCTYRILWLVAANCLFALQSAAQQPIHDSFWNNVDGGIFSEKNNWFPANVPEEEDIVRFETTDSNFFQRTYTVDFHTDAINQQLWVEDDDVTFNLMGHTYELKNFFVAAAIGTVRHPDRSGKLTVINGALKLPAGSDLEIAPVADAKGVLTVGADGVIDGSPDVFVGLNGSGTLNVQSGGKVTADQMTIGANSGATGTVSVTGNGSSLSIGRDLSLIGAGSGTLRIETGGSVGVGGNLRFGGNDAIHLEGGRLSVGYVPPNARFFWTSGTLSFGAFDDNLTIPNGGVLVPKDTINGVRGNLTLLPGATTRATVVTSLPILVQHQVDGHMVLNGGNLQVSLEGGFPPSSQNKYEIITTGAGIFGSFANVANGQRVAAGDGIGSFLVNYGSGSPFDPKKVVLSSYQFVTPGDFDVDGDVDGTDFLVWQRGGSPAPLSATDLAAWRTTFGASGAAATSSAVPEPSGEWIALTAIGLACAVRPGSAAVFAKSHRSKKRSRAACSARQTTATAREPMCFCSHTTRGTPWPGGGGSRIVGIRTTSRATLRRLRRWRRR